ncbi:MAG: hypothetical protein JSV29_07100 [Candidatus Bathyarchaeota archaeon]|jgi:hypothetical protein|nr:MAG: hypothetical protein JSV29_07100 [Candidatus Bathyarchaeota archaeon]
MKRNKVKVEVFVPLDSCVCNFAPLMEKVGEVTSKFKDFVEVQTKSTESPEASKYGIRDMCVVVGGKMRLTSDFDKKELEDAISGSIVPAES